MEKVTRYKICTGEEFEKEEVALEAERFARTCERLVTSEWFNTMARRLLGCSDRVQLVEVLVHSREFLIEALACADGTDNKAGEV